MLKNLFSPRPAFRSAVAALERYGIASDLRARFAAFLQDAPDREVFHFNPRALAERLGLDERAALKLLLDALYEGVVTLHWEIRCPACGSIDHRNTSLNQLHHQFQCPVCQTVSSPRLDDEVRITFSPHPRLRPLPPMSDDFAFRAEVDRRFGSVPGQALLVLPDFQKLFPQERLLPDESLEVARVAVLFTDLAGSTALYAQRGDPRAYHLVRLHFDELLRAADAEGGTVVKTIGDAILGAFQTPAEAMRAALAMQANIAALNQRERLSGDESLILKVGLHSGPCLNVTLNDRPDYFGTTVNIAARVQGLSRGGDIVFTEALRADLEVQTLLNGRAWETSRVALKGIADEVLVHWMRVL
jgi:class 3 adenylate cyclase